MYLEKLQEKEDLDLLTRAKMCRREFQYGNKRDNILIDILKDFFAEPICSRDIFGFDSLDVWNEIFPILTYLKCDVNTFVSQKAVDDFFKKLLEFHEMDMFKKFKKLTLLDKKSKIRYITVSPSVITAYKETNKEICKIIGEFKKDLMKSRKVGNFKHNKVKHFPDGKKVKCCINVRNNKVTTAIILFESSKAKIDITNSLKKQLSP